MLTADKTRAGRQFASPRRRRRMVKRLERRLWERFKAVPRIIDAHGTVEWLPFDARSFRETGLRVLWVPRAGVIEASNIRKVEMPRDHLGFHIIKHTNELFGPCFSELCRSVLDCAPTQLAEVVDDRTKQLLKNRHGDLTNMPATARQLLRTTPNRFSFFGAIRLHEWIEPDGQYFHLEGRLDFGGVLL